MGTELKVGLPGLLEQRFCDNVNNVVLSPKYSYNASCSGSDMGIHVIVRYMLCSTSIFNTRCATFEL
jgi:hypothetical protein